MGDSGGLSERAREILEHSSPRLNPEQLHAYVASFLNHNHKFIELAERFGTPLYLIDKDTLEKRIAEFRRAFAGAIPNLNIFFAMKSCNHPVIVETVIKAGLGVDVSSGQELQLALKLGSNKIIFSGPGKTDEELELAVDHNQAVTVLMDSFGELDKLENIAARNNIIIKAGVRLTTEETGLWRKFGIPLSRLKDFIFETEKKAHIDFCGLQFHTSWNRTPDAQGRFLIRLGEQLRLLPEDYIKKIRFIDIGGGYWPTAGEWLQPAGVPEGRLRQDILDQAEHSLNHYCLPAMDSTIFGLELSETLNRNIFSLIQCEIYAEPGRWICHDALHILMRVIDKKAADIIIADGGINMVGWERYETDYFPVINLSQPELNEKACYIFGSLCTPHDVWGYAYFGRDIKTGDILLIPSQGAYTYSLRQEFIKPIPDTVIYESGEKSAERFQAVRKLYRP